MQCIYVVYETKINNLLTDFEFFQNIVMILKFFRHIEFHWFNLHCLIPYIFLINEEKWFIESLAPNSYKIYRNC